MTLEHEAFTISEIRFTVEVSAFFAVTSEQVRNLHQCSKKSCGDPHTLRRVLSSVWVVTIL